MSPRTSPSMSFVARLSCPSLCWSRVPPLRRKCGVPELSTARCSAATTTVEATSHARRPPAAVLRSAWFTQSLRMETLAGGPAFAGKPASRSLRVWCSSGTAVSQPLSKDRGLGGRQTSGLAPGVDRLAQEVVGSAVCDALGDRGGCRDSRDLVEPADLLRPQVLVVDAVGLAAAAAQAVTHGYGHVGAIGVDVTQCVGSKCRLVRQARFLHSRPEDSQVEEVVLTRGNARVAVDAVSDALQAPTSDQQAQGVHWDALAQRGRATDVAVLLLRLSAEELAGGGHVKTISLSRHFCQASLQGGRGRTPTIF